MVNMVYVLKVFFYTILIMVMQFLFAALICLLYFYSSETINGIIFLETTLFIIVSSFPVSVFLGIWTFEKFEKQLAE
jgi:hypothetical protein